MRFARYTHHYQRLMEKLGENELYSHAKLAGLVRRQAMCKLGLPSNLLRTLSGLSGRFEFPVEGDGRIKEPGRADEPAWYGQRWRDCLARITEPGRESGSGAESPSWPEMAERPKTFGFFLTSLDPFELYSAQEAAATGLKRGLCAHADPASAGKILEKVSRGLETFARTRLPKVPDGQRTDRGCQVMVWFGWRWMLALPDFALPEKRKSQLLERMAAENTSPVIATIGKPAPRLSRVGWGLVATALFFGLGFAVNNSLIHRGFSVLRERGPAAAYRFFAEPQDEQALYGRAWAAFRTGQYTQAREDAERMAMDPAGTLVPEAYYLLGYIAAYTGEYDEALANFQQAVDLYLAVGNEAGTHLSYVGMARVVLDQFDPETQGNEQLDEAATYLDQAEGYGTRGGDYYNLRKRVQFERGDYQGALDLSREALTAFGTDKNAQVQALSDIGFYLILLGDFEEGMRISQQAEGLAIQTGDQRKYIFNLCNEYLYRRCMNLPVETHWGIIEDYNRAHPDQLLTRYMTFLQEVQCAAARDVGPDDPTPPPLPGGNGGGGGSGK